MKTINLTQGSDEWKSARQNHFCASEAAAMMGFSPYQTRAELLNAKFCGEEKEISAHQQSIFDEGHKTEEMARAIIEEKYGEDFYPIVGVADFGLSRPLLASFDGATMDDKTLFEHKQWNEKLAESVKNGEIPAHWVQLEQQLLVSGAEKVIFVVSNGTAEKMVQMEYQSIPERRAALIAGWAQFDEDLQNFKPVEAVAEIIADPIENLPVLVVRISGQVIESNLSEFENAAERLRTMEFKPQTPKDFINADKLAKFLGGKEKELALIKAQTLTQAASINDVFVSIDNICAEFRTKRLELETAVTTHKKNWRIDIIKQGNAVFTAHIAQLNEKLAHVLMPKIDCDLVEAIKGLKKDEAMLAAIDQTVANAKIIANETFNRLSANLDVLQQNSAYKFLFNDLSNIVNKPCDDFQNLVAQRIAAHKVSEKEKEEALKEKIRIEEEQKARAKMEAKMQASMDARKELEASLVSEVSTAPQIESLVKTQITPNTPNESLHLYTQITEALDKMSVEQMRLIAHHCERLLASKEAA